MAFPSSPDRRSPALLVGGILVAIGGLALLAAPAPLRGYAWLPLVLGVVLVVLYIATRPKPLEPGERAEDATFLPHDSTDFISRLDVPDKDGPAQR